VAVSSESRARRVTVSVIDELVRNADSYGESFAGGDLALPPAKRVAIVSPGWTLV
jgi:hypothetical protein